MYDCWMVIEDDLSTPKHFDEQYWELPAIVFLIMLFPLGQ